MLAANSIPMVVFLLVGGVVADRLPRVLVLRAGSVVLAASQGGFAALVLADVAELWMLIALQVVNGATQAVVQPGSRGAVPQLVPREQLQQANVLQSMCAVACASLGPTVAALLVVTVGPGWAVAVDALTWLLGGLLLLGCKLPPAERADDAPSMVAELREGWSLFVGTTWLWVVVFAFFGAERDPHGRLVHAGAGRGQGHHRRAGLGSGAVGRVGRPPGDHRCPAADAAGSVRCSKGMIGMSLLAVPIFMLGADPVLVAMLIAAFVAGAGVEVFSLGWSLAMQENIDERMLSRAYSYDMLGSFVAIPIGQLAYGPLGEAFGYEDVLVVSGIVYAVVALSALLSSSVRNLRRAPGTVPTEVT